MIRELLLVALLAHVAVAQSGVLTFSAAPTNSAYAITLPPATGGQTRVQVNAEGSFSQGLTLWNEFPAPVTARTIFCNEMRLASGDLILASSMRRSRIDLVCEPFSTCSSVVRSTYSAGFTATLPIGQTFTLSNLVRSRVEADIPFGPGNFTHSTSSFAANVVNWAYLP